MTNKTEKPGEITIRWGKKNPKAFDIEAEAIVQEKT